MNFICNKAKGCPVVSCPHSIPHNYIKGKNHPACTDKWTYCYPTGKQVNCVEVSND